jgi:hypothetical protein
MDTEPKDVRIPVMMPRSLVQAVDAWRSRQPDLPPRAEAVRRLLGIGLQVARKDADSAS